MPPRLSKSAKQDLILTHLRATSTCHTLKDLEKTLPSVASINSLQVKEYLQALTGEGKLQVEKIGSGNWYWSFSSNEKQAREQQLARVQTEVGKARKSCADAEAALAAETDRRQREEANHDGLEQEREALMGRKADLESEVSQLRTAEARLTGSLDSVSGKATNVLQEEVAGFRQAAAQWTDNIYVLEAYLRKLAGGDREIVEAVLRECYGDEYADGEGLRELE